MKKQIVCVCLMVFSFPIFSTPMEIKCANKNNERVVKMGFDVENKLEYGILESEFTENPSKFLPSLDMFRVYGLSSMFSFAPEERRRADNGLLDEEKYFLNNDGKLRSISFVFNFADPQVDKIDVMMLKVEDFLGDYMAFNSQNGSMEKRIQARGRNWRALGANTLSATLSWSLDGNSHEEPLVCVLQ